MSKHYIDFNVGTKMVTIGFKYDFILVDAVKKIPGRKYSADTKEWYMALSEENSLQLAYYIKANNPEIKNPEILLSLLEINQKLIKKEEQQNTNFVQSSAMDSNFEVVGLKGNLRPFQKVGIEYAVKNKGVIIGDEMGLGKTIEAIGTMHHTQSYPALIACPNTLKYNWLKECEKWLDKKVFILNTEFELTEDLLVLTGKITYPLDFVKLFKDGYYKMTEKGFRKIDNQNKCQWCGEKKENPFGICEHCHRFPELKKMGLEESNPKEAIIESNNLRNYDIIVMGYNTIIKYEELLKKISWKIFIGDESHYLKNKKAKRTEAVLNLVKNIEYKILLTGTAVVNRPSELTVQLEIINKMNDFGGWWPFVKRYCNAHYGSFGLDLSGATHLNELHEKMRRICYIRRNKKEVLAELPDKQRSIIEIDITNRKEYNKAENDLIEYLKGEISIVRNNITKWEAEGKDWEEIQQLVKDTKEQKINSAMQAEHLVRINVLKRLVAQGKIEGIKEWIDDFLESGEKLIVFAEHVDLIKQLSDYYKCGRIIGETKLEERERLVIDFQENPSTKLLFLNMKTGGVGLTLTSSSNVLFLELGWGPTEHSQAEDRSHRMGQKNSVNCYYVIGKETIDNWIYELIEEKRVITDAINSGIESEKQVNILSELIDKLRNK